ncbi:sigma-70 family RNA polymerase sigma factor [Xenophilus sp. Marseille-Q4582]|uniref:sigma-70 family RNA polymerase sigma factor n=1 Tax=Xenophilus sp. Marseille-Q4582 TaxID=2866600 RepID=UPI001CE40ABB|nr:sigma-70 family RNA polymerase sigma factor [Xenophilus sp. Marseille-Q4582]
MSLTPADAAAAGVLFQDHHSWLLGRLQQRLRNRAEAEDVASETFVRVIGYERVRGLDEPRAYLTTVAKSVLVRQWRRRELERAYLDSLAALPEAVAPSAEERVALLHQLERIAQALDTLSPRARRAFLLSQLDGLTYAEIALEVGVSVSSVRQYMAQGLRACLLATQA